MNICPFSFLQFWGILIFSHFWAFFGILGILGVSVEIFGILGVLVSYKIPRGMRMVVGGVTERVRGGLGGLGGSGGVKVGQKGVCLTPTGHF